MRRCCFALLAVVLAMVVTGTVAKAAGQRPARRRRAAHRLTSDPPQPIALLFSYPAQDHPKVQQPNTPYYNCQPTNPPGYEVCCIWNQHERQGAGAWDCQVQEMYRQWRRQARHPVRRAAMAYITGPGIYAQHVGRCRRVRAHENVCRAHFIDGTNFSDNGQPAPATVNMPVYVKHAGRRWLCSYDPPIVFAWEPCYGTGSDPDPVITTARTRGRRASWRPRRWRG